MDGWVGSKKFRRQNNLVTLIIVGLGVVGDDDQEMIVTSSIQVSILIIHLRSPFFPLHVLLLLLLSVLLSACHYFTLIN